ncbi:small integral membrane protein 45 isoform X2 [Rhinolophus sinicus]|uniref:small integral membrane protein 45 isoform X2 n=1 Tax=Rhinolophus sinicus TaxID=89399 RepID=UPI003D7A9B37
MPHFLDWFVPVYLVISVLILMGFGACIYYFEPGLQEAHKWRMQRPVADRDLRKTLMVRDNLAFGGPECECVRGYELQSLSREDVDCDVPTRPRSLCRK